MIPIDQIIPWEKNPRHNDHAVEKVAESIKRFGFASPIILNHDYTVIAGHTRLKASKLLKLTEIPCRILNLSAEEATALALADNKLSEIAEWNKDDLSEILEDLYENHNDLFFSSGFSENELHDLIIEDEELKIDDYNNENNEFNGFNEGYMDFKFGEYKGLIEPKVFNKFVQKYNNIFRQYPELMIGEIIDIILGNDNEIKG